MKKQYDEERRFALETRSFVTLFLGIATLISAAAYLIYRYRSEKAYREKWADYDDAAFNGRKTS